MSRGAALSLAVFAVLLLMVLATPDDRASVGVRTLALPEISAEAISSIAITGTSNATLRREGERWTVEDPAAPDARRAADVRVANALAQALADLSIAGFVTARTEKHAELEIDEQGGLRVQVETAGGPGLDVVFGRRSKNAGDLIRRSAEDEVFETRNAVALQARREVKEWRRRQITDLSAGDVAALRIEGPERQALRLERQVDGTAEAAWSLAAGPTLPDGFVFEPAVAERAANTLASLRADDFLDDGELGAVDTRVVAEDAEGNALAELRIGRVDEAQRRALEVSGDSQRYWISATAADSIAPGLEALRDLSFLRGGVESLSKVVFAQEGKRFELAKVDGQWQLPAPIDGYDFDPSRVEPRMAALGRAQGLRVLSAEEAVAADFSNPVSITLTDADGSVRTIRLGGPMASDGGPAQIAVESSDGFRYAGAVAERNRYADPAILFERPPPPPPGGGGAPQGLESLPPDIRRQVEAQLRQRGAL